MRVSAAPLLSILPALVGCAGAVSGPESGDAVAPRTSAVVTIERMADVPGGSHAEASARFLRVTAPASADDALRAIGASLDLPAAGSCASISARAGAASGASLPVVELVDLGEVSVEAADVETRLSPRQLPDVTDVVSGVVYARATDPALLPPSTRYVVRVSGAPGLAGFGVAAWAPADAGDVRLAGEDATGVLVATGASIDLSWTAGSADDMVYVDVRPNGVRCVLGDVGHGAVSTLFLDEAGTLVVHRLHRETFRAPGLDSGEVRFDFARTVPYVRR